MKTLDSIDVKNKTVMVRVDFNVPMKDGHVTDVTRILETLPTLQELQKNRAKIVLISHLGRPEGKVDPAFSLKPLVEVLKDQLTAGSVYFSDQPIGGGLRSLVNGMYPGDILLLENLRFYPGEESNDDIFSQHLAALADLYVNDAFSVSHRSHASVSGITRYLPVYAGRLLEKEMTTLEAVLTHPAKPLMAIVGGAKISTKLGLLKNLGSRVQVLALGGGMANTFLYALGHSVGKSLCEPGQAKEALMILETLKSNDCQVILPQDVVIAPNLESGHLSAVVDIDRVPSDQMILDVGPKTVKAIQEAIHQAKTLVWNGELGVTEVMPFDQGTVAVARSVAEQTKSGTLKSIAGGGDTAAALHKAGCFDDFTYVSMAGGAFLEWLEGRVLPGVEALKR